MFIASFDYFKTKFQGKTKKEAIEKCIAGSDSLNYNTIYIYNNQQYISYNFSHDKNKVKIRRPRVIRNIDMNPYDYHHRHHLSSNYSTVDPNYYYHGESNKVKSNNIGTIKKIERPYLHFDDLFLQLLYDNLSKSDWYATYGVDGFFSDNVETFIDTNYLGSQEYKIQNVPHTHMKSKTTLTFLCKIVKHSNKNNMYCIYQNYFDVLLNKTYSLSNLDDSYKNKIYSQIRSKSESIPIRTFDTKYRYYSKIFLVDIVIQNSNVSLTAIYNRLPSKIHGGANDETKDETRLPLGDDLHVQQFLKSIFIDKLRKKFSGARQTQNAQATQATPIVSQTAQATPIVSQTAQATPIVSQTAQVTHQDAHTDSLIEKTTSKQYLNIAQSVINLLLKDQKAFQSFIIDTTCSGIEI